MNPETYSLLIPMPIDMSDDDIKRLRVALRESSLRPSTFDYSPSDGTLAMKMRGPVTEFNDIESLEEDMRGRSDGGIERVNVYTLLTTGPDGEEGGADEHEVILQHQSGNISYIKGSTRMNEDGRMWITQNGKETTVQGGKLDVQSGAQWCVLTCQFEDIPVANPNVPSDTPVQ